jgi:hypothetical protein
VDLPWQLKMIFELRLPCDGPAAPIPLSAARTRSWNSVLRPVWISTQHDEARRPYPLHDHGERSEIMICPKIPKRRALRALAGVALLAMTAQPTFAAEQCLREAEKAAFDMRVLQSELMIAALQCGQHAQYNRFMQLHQTELSSAYDQIGAYFARFFGAEGEEQRDSYITDLANAQAQDQMQHGPDFCVHVSPIVNASLTLATSGDISRFVQEQHVINSYAPPLCTAHSDVAEPSTEASSDRRTTYRSRAPSVDEPTYVIPMPAVGEPLKLLRVSPVNHG